MQHGDIESVTFEVIRNALDAIVEEYDATTVIPPGCSVHVDEFNNIVIDVGSA